MGAVLISGFALSIAGIPTGIYLFSTDFMERLTTREHAFSSLMYAVVLAVFGTALALILFNKLIKTTSVLFVSSVTYLIPVVALMWGLLDNEKLGLTQVAGMIFILGGVYLVNKKSNSNQGN